MPTLTGSNSKATAPRPEYLPRSVLRALWKHKRFIICVWLIGSAVAVAGIYSMHPVYSADTLILVESQKIPENFVSATVQTVLEARLDTLKQQVLSRERLWGLIKEYDLYARERSRLTRNEIVDRMRKDITIGLERGWSSEKPGAFRVAYEAPQARIAAEIANRMGRFFVDENLRARQSEAASISNFLEQQLQESKNTLQQQEAKLKDFKRSFNGELPEQENALLASMAQSRVELVGMQEAIARAQQNKQNLEHLLSAAQDNLRLREAMVRKANESAVSASRLGVHESPPESALERARAELRALRTRYEDKHPDVQRMLAEVVRLTREENERREDARAVTALPQHVDSPDFSNSEIMSAKERVQTLELQAAQADQDVMGLQARTDQLLADIKILENRIAHIPIHEQQLASVTRDYEASKQSYKSLLDKKLAADVAAHMENKQQSERFVILDPARAPEKPIRPKRMLLIVGCALFSLIGAAAIAFVMELRNNVLLGEWELPPGVAVLGRFSAMEIVAIQRVVAS